MAGLYAAAMQLPGWTTLPSGWLARDIMEAALRSGPRAPDPGLASLASLLTPVRLPKGEDLAKRPPALRFVRSGAVAVNRFGRDLPNGVQVLGPGSAHGLGVVARWATHAPLLGGTKAVARIPSELLELEPGRFEQAFGQGDGLLARLLAAREASLRAVELVRVLSATPRLTNAQDVDLFRLVEGAVPVKVDAKGTELLEDSLIPSGFFVVLRGRVTLSSASGLVSEIDAPACVGLDQFLLRTPLPGTVTLGCDGQEGPVAFWVEGAWFYRLLATDSDFARAVVRGSPETLQPPPPPVRHQVIVWGEAEGRLPPWDFLGPLLAERMAVHLHEHVLQVRLEEDARPEDGAPRFQVPLADRNGWVAFCQRPPTRTDGEPLLPASTSTTWMGLEDGRLAGRINVTLVDASALTPAARQRALQRIADEASERGEPVKYVHLSDSRVPPTLVLPPGVTRIKTGVLRSDPPVAGAGLFLARLFAQEEKAPRRERAARLVRAATTATHVAGRHLRQWITARVPDVPSEWPMGTVRVRFPASWCRGVPLPASRDALGQEAVRDTFDRWARALTGRRVGLALGGGGPFGFVSLALLERLDPRPSERVPVERSRLRLPIDMISGSSFGAVVGTFYCIGGWAGLDLLMRHGRTILGLVGLSLLSSAGLEWWTNLQLGPRQLDELEVPFFPVVTDADVGVEWDLRHGSVGRGVRASSSLPPLFGPTLIGNRRLLDGGLVANVPADVLRTEGADLLIAVNPISRVRPRLRKYPRRWVGQLLGQLSPPRRFEDSLRMLQMLGRLTGGAQERGDGAVMYRPELSCASLLGYDAGPRIVRLARTSLEVDQAALRAQTAWRWRLNNPGWLRIEQGWDKTPERIELDLPMVFRDTPGGAELTHGCIESLAELVEFLHTHKAIASFRLRLTAPTETLASRRAGALVDFLRPRIFQEVRVEEGAVRLPEGEGMGPASRVELSELVTRPMTEDVMRQAAEVVEDYRSYLMEALQSQASGRMRSLLSEAERHARRGAPELARLLVLEASTQARLPRSNARYSPRPRRVPVESQVLLDEVLRAVLERHGTCLRVLSHRAATSCVAWSPDGGLLAVGDMTGTVRVWAPQAPEGTEARSYDAGRTSAGHSVNWLDWSPRGSLLASCCTDSSLQVREVGREGPSEPRSEWSVGTWDHWGLRFSPDGGLLLGPAREAPGAGEDDILQQAAVFDLKVKGKWVPVVDASTQPPRHVRVRNASWAPEGDAFATAGDDDVRVWRLARGAAAELPGLTGPFVFPLPGARTVAWHPRKPVLAAGGTSGAVIHGGRPGMQPLTLETLGRGVAQVAWSPDGEWLVTVGGQEVRLFHADSGRLRDVFHVEGAHLEGVAWNPERRGVLATWNGNLAQVWDVETGQVLATLTGHSGRISQVAWNPDGRRLATASLDATVRVWDFTLGGPERYRTWDDLVEVLSEEGVSEDALPAPPPLPPAPGTPRGGLATSGSPDGTHLAVQESTRTFSLFAAPGRHLERVSVDFDLVRMAWHPSGEALGLALWKSGGPGLYLLGERRLELPVTEEGDGLWDLTWSPSSEQLATACNDGWARVYACTRGSARIEKLLWKLRLVFPASRVAWSPDGQFLATGDRGGVVGIWDSRGYDRVASPQSRWLGIQHLVWNPGGTSLFSASEDGRGLLWRQDEEGRWVIAAALESEPVPLRWAAFSRDGRWLAVMARDGGSVRLHAIDFDTLVDRVVARGGRDAFTAQERTLYLQGRPQLWRPASTLAPGGRTPGARPREMGPTASPPLP